MGYMVLRNLGERALLISLSLSSYSVLGPGDLGEYHSLVYVLNGILYVEW